jgi:hypothetical protein
MIPRCTVPAPQIARIIHVVFITRLQSYSVNPVPLCGQVLGTQPLSSYDRSFCMSRISGGKKKPYPAFFRIFVPMRNNFRTVPVGSRFI